MHLGSLVSIYPSTFVSLPPQRLAESTSGVSDSSTDNTTSLHPPGPGIASTSMQTMQLSGQFQSHSSSTPHPLPSIRDSTSVLLDLLDQDSEMQRAMGVADSFDGASTNQGPPRRSHSYHRRYLLSVHRTHSLTSCSSNDSTLPSGSASLLSHARGVFDRVQTDCECIAPLRRCSYPER